MDFNFSAVLPDTETVAAYLQALWSRYPNLPHLLTRVIRYGLVFTAVLIVYSCTVSLLREKQVPETWGYLTRPDGTRIPLQHWENIVGRARSSDVCLASMQVSRTHAALMRDDAGRWRVYNINPKNRTSCGSRVAVPYTEVHSGEELVFGDERAVFHALNDEEQRAQAKRRPSPGRLVRPWVILFYVSEFQILLCMQHVIAAEKFTWTVPLSFITLGVVMWTYFFFVRVMRRTGFEVESLGFFLTSIGFSVVATSTPSKMLTVLVSVCIGLVIFLVLCVILRKRERSDKLRWLAALGAAGLLAATLVFGTSKYGAKNWIIIGGFSLQPSELAKICFIYAGTATLDRLFARRNLFLFIVLTGVCMGALALMSDFGTALVFFAVFVVIAYMRSGDIATTAFILAGAGIGGMLILKFKPYIASRFATWRHAWENASVGAGYQQTRAMSAAASGGLFGMGAGNGWLHRVGAADTDLVFGIVCEELGLIIALLAVASFIVLAYFAVRCAAGGRSTFYAIAASAAVASFIVQILLNVGGCMDLLPMTGVTFPFVSNGGSAMMGAWGLLAFIKAADNRQNASLAIPLLKRKKKAQAVQETPRQAMTAYYYRNPGPGRETPVTRPAADPDGRTVLIRESGGKEGPQ